MALKDLTPKAEPAIWSMIVASAIAALGSYGLNITDEMGKFLMLVLPYVLGFIVVRFSVFAPDSVKEIQDEAYEAGTPPSKPKPPLPEPPGGGEPDTRDWGVYNMDEGGDLVREENKE